MWFLLPPKLLLFRNLDYCAGLNFSFIKNLSNPFPVYTLYCSKCEIPPHFEKILAKKFIILSDQKKKKYCSTRPFHRYPIGLG